MANTIFPFATLLKTQSDQKIADKYMAYLYKKANIEPETVEMDDDTRTDLANIDAKSRKDLATLDNEKSAQLWSDINTMKTNELKFKGAYANAMFNTLKTLDASKMKNALQMQGNAFKHADYGLGMMKEMAQERDITTIRLAEQASALKKYLGDTQAGIAHDLIQSQTIAAKYNTANKALIDNRKLDFKIGVAGWLMSGKVPGQAFFSHEASDKLRQQTEELSIKAWHPQGYHNDQDVHKITDKAQRNAALVDMFDDSNVPLPSYDTTYHTEPPSDVHYSPPKKSSSHTSVDTSGQHPGAISKSLNIKPKRSTGHVTKHMSNNISRGTGYNWMGF